MEENTENKQEVEVIDVEASPVIEKKKLTRKEKRHMDLPGNPLQGRKLFNASKFFFVTSCVVTAIVGATIALPFITIIVGMVSVLIWFVFVSMGTLLTIGLMWTVQDIKNLNGSWMDFNTSVFNSGSVIADAMITAVPIIAGIGLAIIITTWILLGVGYKKDEFRKKKYKTYLIILIFVSALFIALSIATLVARFSS